MATVRFLARAALEAFALAAGIAALILWADAAGAVLASF